MKNFEKMQCLNGIFLDLSPMLRWTRCCWQRFQPHIRIKKSKWNVEFDLLCQSDFSDCIHSNIFIFAFEQLSLSRCYLSMPMHVPNSLFLAPTLCIFFCSAWAKTLFWTLVLKLNIHFICGSIVAYICR